MIEAKHTIVLFDGDCNFCNSSVNFIIKRDHQKNIRFTPLESLKGKQLQKTYSLPSFKYGSVVLIENNNAYTKSTAVLKISKKLSGLYPLLYVFMIIPKMLRDVLYDLIAKNRHRIKKDTCIIPDQDIRERFLEI